VTTPTEQREQAIAAADGACPRCGAPRTAEQEYCVDCGLRLPPVKGRLPSLRRRWIRRVGWYPGDWVWVSLVTLLVAAAGAAVAIAISHRAHDRAGRTVLAPTQSLPVHQPPPAPATTAGAATLPVAPEPTTTTKAHHRPAHPKPTVGTWPANRNGWTIVLVSYPKTNGASAAHATALRALQKGLPLVGVLDSSAYASLQPGYLVVFTGEYGSQDAANAALATARQAGFAAAYVRQVAG
jgi:hypothetical protein